MYKIIYFDLDGVLADFEKSIFEKTGVRLGGTENFKDKAMKNQIFNDPTFFRDLDVMHDAYKMTITAEAHCDDIQILTATGYTNSDMIAKQKMEWAKEHFPDYPVNFVQKSDMKAKFAWPGDGSIILIDDRQVKSIDPWVKAGGTGIHHISPFDTIDQLDILFDA